MIPYTGKKLFLYAMRKKDIIFREVR